jgi:DTW domain-containing protein YfiP
MHPKEFKKTKNGTGHFTHLSLNNSKIFIGIDFNNHIEINTILEDINNDCFVLYPAKDSISLNKQSIKQNNKNIVVFIIDSTWPCSKKILAVSKNIAKLPKISFEHNRLSQFKIKIQPNKYCLSTIESTQVILELLTQHNIENITQKQLKLFTKPFDEMVKYQVDCVINTTSKKPRFLTRSFGYLQDKSDII